MDGAGNDQRTVVGPTLNDVNSSPGSPKVCPACGMEYGAELRFCPQDGSTLRRREPSTDLVGQTIGDKYYILGKLGEGGMGQVFLAEHVKLKQRRAVKVMHRALINDVEAVRRFTGEALRAGKVHHSNVAAVVDCGETGDGTAYLVMEYVDGESLTRLLQREGALPFARAAAIVAQAAEGLTAAHELGIVHRDMKPDNILITRGRDAADLVKVVDFGIAKATQDAVTQVTRPGFVVGTPEYMSPEQASGRELDVRSDTYSLALVAYESLTGKLPFRGNSPSEVMLARLMDPPAPLAAVRPDIAWPRALQSVFDSALARAPFARFATAREFSAALHEALHAQFTGAAATGASVPAPTATPRGAIPAVPSTEAATAPWASAALPLAWPTAATPSLTSSSLTSRSLTSPSPPTSTASPHASPATHLTLPGEPVGTGPSSPRQRLVAMAGGAALAAAALIVVTTALRDDVRQPPAERPVAVDTSLAKDLALAAVATRPDTKQAAEARRAVPSQEALSRPTYAVAPRRTRPRSATVPPPTSSAAPRQSRSPSVAPATPAPATHYPEYTSTPQEASSREALDRLRRLTESPGASAVTAREALVVEAELLPRLTTRADTVEAWLRRLQAYHLIGDRARACALLSRLSSAAAGSPFEGTVSRYRNLPELRCNNGYSPY